MEQTFATLALTLQILNIPRTIDLMRPDPITAAVVTVSDSCSQGRRVDLSGPAVAEILASNGFALVEKVTVPDEEAQIAEVLRRCAETTSLVITTGGTGLAPRDVTPEATREVCDRILDGLAEVMRAEGRKETPFAALGRGICGSRCRCLILNLPGSPRGAVSSLNAVLPLIPHALALLGGGDVEHSDAANSRETSNGSMPDLIDDNAETGKEATTR